MRIARTLTVALLVSLACGACASDAVNAVAPIVDAPALLNANPVLALVAGTIATYDATRGGTVFSDPVLRGLTYSIALSGNSSGLTATGGTVSGVPSEPGAITATLTAVDALGRSASNTFGIVVFANGLPVPNLSVSYDYSDAGGILPLHFSALVNGVRVTSTDNTPAFNAITDAGATLGRVLFHDTRLSANDGTSCASCHAQSLGFSDALPRSVGFAGGLTSRRSPALANARFYARGRFFWDERAPSLEAQVLAPIQDAVEMGMTLDALVMKLTATPYYGPLFGAAFGSTTITSERVALALSQYVRSLVSGGSRYDRAFSATGVPNFGSTLTPSEIAGEQLFRSVGCASCHTTLAQVSDSVHDIGLDAVPADTGAGRGAFKAPSLRNAAVRTHFMHDGRFTTLEQVVDFHDSGVQPSPGLDARLKAANGTPRRLGLTAAQKASLVAFMRSLTDSTFLTAPRFSNPFVVAVPTQAPVPNGSAVTMQANAYRPSLLTVAPSTVITFTNLDNARHSATFALTTITSTPIFTSGSRTVTMPVAAGTYVYQCAIHGAAMRGTIIVR